MQISKIGISWSQVLIITDKQTSLLNIVCSSSKGSKSNMVAHLGQNYSQQFSKCQPGKWRKAKNRTLLNSASIHDDVIEWKHFPRYWPFVRGIHRSPVNSTHKGQWRGALIFFFDLSLNKWLSKQSWGWRFETPSCPLRRHCNVIIYLFTSKYVFMRAVNLTQLQKTDTSMKLSKFKMADHNDR